MEKHFDHKNWILVHTENHSFRGRVSKFLFLRTEIQFRKPQSTSGPPPFREALTAWTEKFDVPHELKFFFCDLSLIKKYEYQVERSFRRNFGRIGSCFSKSKKWKSGSSYSIQNAPGHNLATSIIILRIPRHHFGNFTIFFSGPSCQQFLNKGISPAWVMFWFHPSLVLRKI